MPVVEERLSVLEVQMQEVGATLVRIEDVLGGLVKLVTSLDERVEKLDQRVEKLDQRVERLDQRVDKLDRRIDRLEQCVETLDRRVDRFDVRVEKRFLWVAGIQMTTLITIMAGLFGLVAKLI